MAIVTRAEVAISAKNNLAPGLASAVAALKRAQSAMQAAQPRIDAMQRLKGAATTIQAGAAALAGSAIVGGVKQTVVRFAELDRSMTRIGITGDASAEQTAAGLMKMRELAMEVAAPVNQVKEGLDALTSSGLSFNEAMVMLPSITRTAQASGAAFSDIANSSLATIRHLKIQAKDLQLAQDMMTTGGQLGQFELKDMARYLPSLAPMAKAVGFEGTKGLAKMISMLQIVREGVGTSEEAATAFSDVMGKMESQETVNKFDKLLGKGKFSKEMEAARKSGANLFDTFLKMSSLALKGDMSKLPQLFADKEAQKGMRALLSGMERIPELSSKVEAGGGAVAANLKKITNDTQAAIDRTAESADRLKTSVGGLAANILDLGGGNKFMQYFAKQAEDRAKELQSNPPGQMDSVTGELIRPPSAREAEEMGQKFQASYSREAELRKNLATYRTELAELKASNRPVAKRRAERLEGTIGAAESDLANVTAGRAALGPYQPLSHKDIMAQMPAHLRDEGDRARAAAKARGLEVSEIGKKTTVPLPKARPDSLPATKAAPVIFPGIQGFEEAKTGAAEVKTAISEIGPAGQQAGSALASGFMAGLAQMEAQTIASVGRMQAALNSLKSPNLSGGVGGFNTGRSMDELR